MVDFERNTNLQAKSALLEAIMGSPQFLPSSWLRKYDQWKAEADKETNGINWYRVLLYYPRQKSFYDGPEDACESIL